MDLGAEFLASQRASEGPPATWLAMLVSARLEWLIGTKAGSQPGHTIPAPTGP